MGPLFTPDEQARRKDKVGRRLAALREAVRKDVCTLRQILGAQKERRAMGYYMMDHGNGVPPDNHGDDETSGDEVTVEITPAGKPGWRTTEFWLTLGMTFLAALVASGYAGGSSWAGLEAPAALAAAAAVIWRYVAARQDLKGRGV